MPNILRRPMFRLGGQSSDGVGITSGLNRRNYAESNYGDLLKKMNDNPNMSSQDYANMMSTMLPNLITQMQGAGKMDNYDLAMLISNVAGKGGSISDMVTEATTQVMPYADRYKKTQAAMGPAAFSMLGTMGGLAAKSEAANRPLLPEVKTRMLEELATWKTDKVDENGEWINHDDNIEWQARMNIIDSGFLTETEARVEAGKIVKSLEEFEEAGNSKKNRILKAWIDFLTGRSESVSYAQGGRVGLQNSFPGTVEQASMAEQIQTPGGVEDITENEEVIAEGQENVPRQPHQDPFVILRARLPKEITDDVVKLIAYNPDAFKDFAAIETQQDVINFNETYGVELVLPTEQV